MSIKKEKIPNVKCRICGREFYATSWLLRHGWGRHCSKRCRDAGQKNGHFVDCSYCGQKVYRTFTDFRKESKTKTYFCNKSCQCAWKNKHLFLGKNKRKIITLKKSWRPWCSSSIGVCGTPGAGANPVGLPTFFLKFKKKKINPQLLKRPSKKLLCELYWKENYTQVKIAKIFNATHTSVKRWFDFYKISVKPRTLSCGRNPSSIKNLELGKTPEAERKSAEARKIYTKEKLIQMIKSFVDKNGRIPTKNEFVKNRNSSYSNHSSLRDYFGSWNNAIKAAGYEPNEQWFTTVKARDLYAKDGHKCNSVSEIIIDDWLFENHISHTRECPYPEGRYSSDFMVNNIFIEFFGLANVSNMSLNYREIMEKKREMCKKYKILLVELYEKDLYNLHQSLGGKLDLQLKQKGLFEFLKIH